MIDASVVLAWLQDEPGSDVAERHLMEGTIGAANWSEVLQKARQHGAQAGLVARLLTSFGLRVADVTVADAERAADLWAMGSPLSLADRLCLALGARLGLPVVTTDAAWRSARGGPRVILARG
ncbi:MAG: type II toxin-antitoxin system VapC family toxin [Chloroflexota bacterium]|nr:type II toxin-antitoxin system VapC family toxin [Chloroflexota bacterium]